MREKSDIRWRKSGSRLFCWADLPLSHGGTVLLGFLVLEDGEWRASVIDCDGRASSPKTRWDEDDVAAAKEALLRAARRCGKLPAEAGDGCVDHWHCDPRLASHRCDGPDRSRPCPSCGQAPARRRR